MQITDRVNDFGSTFSNLIRGTNHVTSIDSAPGHPDSHSIFIMIASEALPSSTLTVIRCSTKFTAPDYQGFIQQTPILEILN